MSARDHRAASDSECRASGAEILARAREHNVIAADELPGVLAAIDEVRNGPEEHRGSAPGFSLESVRAMLANLEHLPPDVSADDARVDLWVELREACDEVERLRLHREADAAEAQDVADDLERSPAQERAKIARLTATLKRWQARARKAEARVAVLTEERDGLTLRLGEKVAKVNRRPSVTVRRGCERNVAVRMTGGGRGGGTGQRAKPARTRKGGR